MKKFIAILLTAALALSVFCAASAVNLFKGDLNGDGQIIAGEARSILRMSARLDPQPAPGSAEFLIADVDGDGQILASDARKTLRVSAKLDPAIPLAETENVIDVCLASEPFTMDPALNSSVDGSTMILHLFSGLARWAADESGAVILVPDCAKELAEGVENADGTVTYTYALRDGLKWSDGSDLTAQDFVYAWNRAADPATEADYAYMMDVIVRNADGTLAVNAPDKKTLTVTIANYIPYWNELLAFPTYMPVKKSAVEADSGNWANEAATYVSNGMYKLTGWEHDSLITIEKNPDHPDADLVTMDIIRFHLSDDAGGMLDGYLNHELQMIDDVPAQDIANLRVGAADELKIGGQLGTYYASFNVNRSLLPAGSTLTGAQAEAANAQIRNALSLLINRNHITEDIARGGQMPASSLVAMGHTDADGLTEFYQNAGDPASNGYIGYYDVSPEAYDANVKAALETLKKYWTFDEAERKFTDAPVIDYIYNSSPAHGEIAEYIKNVFASYGIEMTVAGMEWDDFQEAKRKGEFTFARGGWISDFNDPISFLDMWVSGSGNNEAGLGKGEHAGAAVYDLDLTPYGIDVKVKDGTWAETYDRLIDVIRHTRDNDVRYKLMHLAEDMLMATGGVCPIYYYTDLYMIAPSVQGFFATPLGFKCFAYASIAR